MIPGGSPGGGSQSPDWASYISKNTDVANEYLRNMGSSKGRDYLAALGISSVQDFGKWHWETYGKAEGRAPFATGGSFTVGGTGGTDSQAFGPIALSPGEIVDVRRPGDKSKENAETVAVLKAAVAELQRVNAELKADKVQRAAVAEQSDKRMSAMEAQLAKQARQSAVKNAA